MRNSYATGEVHIGWATLDMVPLFVDGFVQAGDSRVCPAFSSKSTGPTGGDGIVVARASAVANLRGKKSCCTELASQYFALNMLVAGGLQPRKSRWSSPIRPLKQPGRLRCKRTLPPRFLGAGHL